MKHLLLLIFLFISCGKREVVKSEVDLKFSEGFSFKSENISEFTPNQEYEIMCWVIKKFENYSSKKYYCQAGKRTVGWGFTHVSYVKDIHHADEIFKDIVNPLFNEVRKTYPKLTYLQCAAITSLYYNTGDLKGIKKSKFVKSLSSKDIENAIKGFKSWNKVKVNGNKYIISKGLVRRRSFEAKLLSNTFTLKDYFKLKKSVSLIYIKNKKC